MKKSKLEQSRAETMVYVHTNLHLIYKEREDWLKGKTKMWDVFPDDMGLDTTAELALANMDLSDPVLEPVRFDDLEGSTSIPADAEATMDTREEEDAEESNGDHDDGDSYADSDAD